MEKEILFTDEAEPPGTSPCVGQPGSRMEVVGSKYGIGPKPNKPKIAWIRKAHAVPRFQSGPQTLAFRKRFFPITTTSEWNDWHWQLRHRISHLVELSNASCGSQMMSGMP